MAPMLRSCSDQGMRVPGVILKTHLPSSEPDPVRRRALLRSGRIRAVGHWYVTDEAPQDLVDVLALHLRPTCLDAAALHGLWVPISEGTHVFRPRTVALPSGRARRQPAHPGGARTYPGTAAALAPCSPAPELAERGPRTGHRPLSRPCRTLPADSGRRDPHRIRSEPRSAHTLGPRDA